MAQKISDVMTKKVHSCEHETTLVAAAKAMESHDIGNVVVTRDGKACGIVTDRDIVVRGLARDCDPKVTTVGDICSHDLVTLRPDASLEEAKKLMSEKAIRRLPVVDNGKPVGIVSLGDIAIESSGERPLEDISAAPSNN